MGPLPRAVATADPEAVSIVPVRTVEEALAAAFGAAV